jgi:hypothetical protein
MNESMLARRLTLLLAALLAVLGLSALPTASLARSSAPASHRVVDDPSQTDEGGEVDDEIVDDQIDESDDFDEVSDEELDVCGDSDLGDDYAGDEEDLGDGEDAADFREAPADDGEEDLGDDEILGDEEDPTPGDDVICETGLFDEDAIFEDLGARHGKELRKKGSLTDSLDMPDAGTIDATLTAGDRVLGTKHAEVEGADIVDVRIKLTPKGRRILRRAKSALELTLRTQISLAGGQEVDRSRTLTVKPDKKVKKPKKPKQPKHKGKRT